LQALIFISYFLVFIYLLSKLTFFKNANLAGKVLVAVYILKVIAGCYYGWYFHQAEQSKTCDTWSFFKESCFETDWLLQNPINFFVDIFHSNYQNRGGLFIGHASYWNDLKTTFFVKILAIINVFTGKNYYTNVLFFNFICMYGIVALYRAICNEFLTNSKWILAAIALTPSFLFWSSGIHKDGFVFSLVAIIILFVQRALQCGATFKNMALILVCFLSLFAIKNHVFFAILPCVFCWVICNKTKLNIVLVFSISIALAIGCIIVSSSLFVNNNLATFLVAKHNEFLLLEGNSRMQTPVLLATLKSVFFYFGYAVESVFLRPFSSDLYLKSHWAVFLEQYALLVFYVVALFVCGKKIAKNSMAMATMLFAVLLCIIIGYIVCFWGAIVRYRSMATPFLIAPLFVVFYQKIKCKQSSK
jgi:hypothetical protein